MADSFRRCAAGVRAVFTSWLHDLAKVEVVLLRASKRNRPTSGSC